MNILIVAADTATFRLFEGHVPASVGGQCHHLSCLDDVPTRVAALGWDLVVCDGAFPGLDLRRVLADIHGVDPELPVYLVSSRMREEPVAELIRAGITDIVAKDNLPRLAQVLQELPRERRVGRAGPCYTESLANAILDMAPEAMLVADSCGRVVRANRGAADMFGYSEAELLALGVEDLLPERHREDHARHRSEFRSNGSVHGMSRGRVLHAIRRDGTLFAVEVSLSSVVVQDQRLVIALVVDITARELAQLALQASAQRFATVFRAAPLGLAVAWLPGREVIEINEAALAILGYDREEILGHTFTELGIWADPQERAIFLSVDEATDHKRSIAHLRQKSGDVVTVDFSMGRIELDGRVCLLGLMVDMTERERAQEALRASEARLRSYVEHAPLGVLEIDGAGRIVAVNPAALHMLRYPSESAMQGLSVLELHPPEERSAMAGRLARLVDGPIMLEFNALRGDGTLVPTCVWLVRLPSGQTIGFGQDMSTLQQLQKQLLQAQKMQAIGQLTAGIAHDFNNILSIVQGYTCLAQEGCATEPRAQLGEYLDEIYLAARRAADLVSKMLVFSRRRSDDEKMVPLLATPIVKEMTRTLRAVIPSSIDIVTELAEDVAAIAIDAVELQQMLMNLVVNARDAMQGTGRLTIALHGAAAQAGICDACLLPFGEPMIELSVTDTGCGVAAEFKHRMFEPFFSTKEAGHGTGMGLSMVHGILARAGGHVVVDSSPGRGTTFRLLFPPAPANLAPAESAAQGGLAPRRGARVLLIDDEPSIMQVASTVLKRAGYQVRAFCDSRQALKYFSDHAEDVDAVVTDQTMPGLQGDVLARSMLERCPSLPILLCTGYSEAMDPARAAAIGVRALVSKPFAPDELLQALARILV